MGAVAKRRAVKSTRLQYYRRILSAYLTNRKSHLSFWHEKPEVNPTADWEGLGEYFMPFAGKADYAVHMDADGVPMLDYHGQIGVQYNPIAIAQYGLGNYNLFRRTAESVRKQKFVRAADWLTGNLTRNPAGMWVWNHHFDWEYRTALRAPWYSGLAQGQGISLLVRAHRATGAARYLEAARSAFETILTPVASGGVAFVDQDGDTWIEEYIVDPPTHILNGFIWAAWGVRDFELATGDARARDLFSGVVKTLKANLHRYDCGYWSLYEQSGTRMKMLASPFYHALHIVQLDIMHRLTGEQIFADYARRWDEYGRDSLRRNRALVYKSIFKLCYY